MVKSKLITDVEMQGMMKSKLIKLWKALNTVDRKYFKIPSKAKFITIRHDYEKKGILIQWEV